MQTPHIGTAKKSALSEILTIPSPHSSEEKCIMVNTKHEIRNGYETTSLYEKIKISVTCILTQSAGADLAFFQGGGGGFDPTASRFFFCCYFEPP